MAADLRKRLLDWERSIRPDSPMYARIALAVAGDDAMHHLLRAVPPGQLHMNLLLAAVQYLLFEERDHPLAAYYPSLGGERDDAGLEDTFIEFALSHRAQIADLLVTRRVQTNEVRRCTFLLPAYHEVTGRTGRPLAVVEVGTSAGLNQNVDRYGYRYATDQGPVEIAADAPLVLECDVVGPIAPRLDAHPDIRHRTGIDINPVDVGNPDEARWLRALVWPDKPERHRRLERAIDIAVDHPPSLIEGDAFEVLGEVVAAVPEELAVVVQHSFVLNQFERSSRERFFAMLDEWGMDRPLVRIGAEWLVHRRGTVLDLTVHGAERHTVELASVHHHGEWMRWMAPPAPR